MSDSAEKSFKSNELSVYAQLALGMASFGSATPVSKIVTQAMPVFIGSVLRVAIGAMILAPVALRHASAIAKLSLAEWRLIVLIALFGMFGFSALMLYGMKMVSGVTGAIVMSTTPAVTATAAVLFMDEKLTWRKTTAIILAVLGVLILHVNQGNSGVMENASKHQPILGSLMIFAAVCCEAVYTLLGKKISEKTDPVLVAFLAAALSIPLFIPFAIFQWPHFSLADVNLRAWIALIWYGAGTLALGTYLWYTGLKKAQGSIAAGFMGVMPVSALILSYILLGEPFKWIHLLGFFIVLNGVLLISWEHMRIQHTQQKTRSNQ